MDKLESVVTALQEGTTQQLVESAQKSRETVRNAQLPPPPEVMDWLWQMMGSMYGHKWVSSYGPLVDPDRVWASCLRGISRDQIRFGLNRCALEQLQWPPSAPEFRGLCLDENNPNWEHGQIRAADKAWAADNPAAQLEDKTQQERTRAKAQEALAQMRAAVRHIPG